MTENEVKPAEEIQAETSSETPPAEATAADSGPAFHLENILMKRFIATFIDMVLIGVSATILIVPGMWILPKSPVNFGALFGFFVFAAAAGAMLLKDMPYKFAELDGQSPGKKAMNIRVTNLSKEPITMQQSINRNLIPASGYIIAAISSLINVIPLGFITGIAGFFIIVPLLLISMAANLFEIYKIFSGKRNRRWGDQFAETIVSWE